MKAEKAFWQVLNSFEEMLGNDHSDTLVTVFHLRLVLRHQGKQEEAEILYQRAMSGFEKIVGKEHPDTLPSVSSLANVLQEQGKYGGAEGLHRRVLGAREKILGKEHPSLMNIGNLANVLRHQGKYEDAEELNHRAMREREIRPKRHSWISRREVLPRPIRRNFQPFSTETAARDQPPIWSDAGLKTPPDSARFSTGIRS